MAQVKLHDQRQRTQYGAPWMRRERIDVILSSSHNVIYREAYLCALCVYTPTSGAAVQDGQYNKALKALTSDGLAPPTTEVLQEMLNKHPQDSLPATPPGPAPPTSTLSEAALKKGVRSFPNGSAPGPSGQATFEKQWIALHPTEPTICCHP